MQSRSTPSGAFLRLSMIAAIAASPLAATAQPGAHPRPPARSANAIATLPVAGVATGAAQTAHQSALTHAHTGKGKELASISAAEIESAIYAGGDLPPGQSALTAKVQILLDRSGVSPGVVDGWRGGMSESAIKAFQRRAGLPMTGRMEAATWDLLQVYSGEALTTTYTITAQDAEGLVDKIPSDYAEKAAMSSQGFTSILEKLGERFHMDERFLAKLNPGMSFEPGATISVTKPAKPIRATVTRIIIDKETRRVAAYDAKGRMVADYPATVGSSDTPSPHGNHVVRAVALNPTYTYNPGRNFKQGDNDRVLIVPPGPNGPVGNVWIDLSEPTYGLHGTATPSRLFVNQSHGCVRLTNWDAWELAHMVRANVTTVEFLDPGVSIADVTGIGAAPVVTAANAVAQITAIRPPVRSTSLSIRSGGVPGMLADTLSGAESAAASVASSLATNPVPPEPVVKTPGEALTEALADEMLARRAQDAALDAVGTSVLPSAPEL